ncbi:Sec8 exocyst complex component-specific domain-containing protein [Lineolata rhizophorae]|uniref:Exocyst complex component Sec8 n=1 Tax=Lineolata rhizophorae TaxID=578093 RepID=A0A6A6NLC2_9PEZI|nr:Sec8 exocyst complex component-specific domain-containing protein [Lineolata rhizophorae]
MSWNSSLRNGYGGGYDRGYDSSPGRDRSADSRGPPGGGGGRSRRAGGYGGLGGGPEQTGDYYEEQPRGVPRPNSLERRSAKRRSGDRHYDPSRSKSGPRGGRFGDGSRQIDEVLDYISQNWSFMTDENCIPIQVALKLLDSSSLGLATRYDQFQDTNDQLQNALKAIVNEHHQGFNSSIGTFHKIQSSLQGSQNRVRALRDSLIRAKLNLSATRPELKEYAVESQNYDDMLQLLGAIEQLQLIPEKLEARISEKRFITAVDILQDALKMIRRTDMESIGALSDLRVYLSNQEHSLTDILIEELHSHLYLKSPYCEDRWKIYAQNQAKVTAADGSTTAIDIRGRALDRFLNALDTSTPLTDDASRNPEANTFEYIHLLIEALNNMGRLDAAVDTIEQRLPVELFRVVEKSNIEVDQRHPSVLRSYAKGQKPTARPVDAAMNQSDEARGAILQDLLWTLYARFEAIAEGHRVVYEVVAGITKREGLRDAAHLTGGFKELWKLYQSEMRSLLHDYLATDSDTVYGSAQKQKGTGSIFRKTPRDKNKPLFKLKDMDTKSPELSTERDDLEFILKSSVPGLVSDSRRAESTLQPNSSFNQDGSATGHKLLIEPSVFNMGVLLPPSLAFLTRLKEVVPRGTTSDIVMSTLTSFLDDFLVNVFHPQLDETLMELCVRTFIEVDAFQQDSQWQARSQKPIFKGTAKFFALITAFCKLLDNLPHDQVFSQLVISQMVTYFEKCQGWYKALVSRAQQSRENNRRLKAAAAFSEDEDLLSALVARSKPDANIQQCVDKENAILITKAQEQLLEEADLLSDKKSITSLCLLYTSMKWLASKIGHLRYISDRAVDSSRRKGRQNQQQRRWTMVVSTGQQTTMERVYLPLNQETALEFDGVVDRYNKLADTVLNTLHFEVRCEISHYVSRAFQPPFYLEHAFTEPDADVVTLNTSLVSFEEVATAHLRTREHDFITTGLGRLTDALVLSLATRGITEMNEAGAGRAQLDILVLQQNLKTMEPPALLVRSSRFFDLFGQGAETVVMRVKDAKARGKVEEELGLGYDELKVLVELCYSEALKSPRRDIAEKAKRNMDEQLLALSECLWQESGPDEG